MDILYIIIYVYIFLYEKFFIGPQPLFLINLLARDFFTVGKIRLRIRVQSRV